MMPKRAATPEEHQNYNRIVEAFLMLGPRFGEVARQVGISTVSANRAWNYGFPEIGYPPIANTFRELVRRRKNLVEQNGRTEVLQAVEAEVCLPTDVAIPTPVEAINASAGEATFNEVDILDEFRKNLTAALGVSNVVLGSLDRLAQVVADRLVNEAGTAPFLSVEGLITSMEKLTKATTNMAQTTKTVFELQRLLQGAPTSITEHRTTGSTGNQGGTPGITAELQEKLVQAGNVIDMMRRHRGLLPESEQAKAIDVDADSAYEGEEEHGVAAGPPVSIPVPEAPAEASGEAGERKAS